MHRSIRRSLGRACPLSANHALPAALAAPPAALARVVSGVAESLLLTQAGELYTHGHRGLIAANGPAPALYQLNVRDADVDETHAAFLFADGAVVLEARGRQRRFGPFAGARALACGAEEALVLVEGADCDELHAIQLPRNDRDFHRAHRLQLLNALLRERRARVAKLRLAGAAGAMLLADGGLFTWGVNAHGNVGVPSSLLRLTPQEVYRPKEPMRAAGLAGAVRDIALSVNVLAALTADGRALYCGFEDVFLLREARLPDGERPARVCAWEGNLGIVGEGGALYARHNFDEDERPARYYADCGLYRIGAEYFDQREVLDVCGKYANAIAVTR